VVQHWLPRPSRQRSTNIRLTVAALVALLAICALVLVGLFAPGLRYSLLNPVAVPIASAEFLNELEPLVNSKITRNNEIEVIENGDHFYEAELDAMRRARHSINIEAYIFHKGKLTDEVLQVLTERGKVCM
jgi:cardiolipin synthase